jgi:hypothetical protein
MRNHLPDFFIKLLRDFPGFVTSRANSIYRHARSLESSYRRTCEQVIRQLELEVRYGSVAARSPCSLLGFRPFAYLHEVTITILAGALDLRRGNSAKMRLM